MVQFLVTAYLINKATPFLTGGCEKKKMVEAAGIAWSCKFMKIKKLRKIPHF